MEPEIPPCAVCGKPAAIVIDGVVWCEGCYHEMGSCCGEWHEGGEAEQEEP